MKKYVSILAVSCLMVLAGCDKNEKQRSEEDLSGVAYVNIQLVNASGTKAPNGTTVDATEKENKIKMLEFYVFDNTGSTPDVNVDATTPGYYKIIPASGQTSVGLNQTLRMSAGENKKIIVAANMNLGALTPGMETYDQVRVALSTAEFKNTAGNHNACTIVEAGLEMSGYSTQNKIAEGEGNKLPLMISRLVNRIDKPTVSSTIEVKLTQEQADEVWGKNAVNVDVDGISFSFQGYAVVNGLSRSTVLFAGNNSNMYTSPQSVAWDTWSTTGKINLPSTFDPVTHEYTNNYSGEHNGSWFISSGDEISVYAFENKPQKKTGNNVTGYDPKTVYAYIIKGELTAKGVIETRYWRVNLTRDDHYHMMRNCVYQVTINKILTSGYDSPKDAEDDVTIIQDPSEIVTDFIITVAKWDLNEYSTAM